MEPPMTNETGLQEGGMSCRNCNGTPGGKSIKRSVSAEVGPLMKERDPPPSLSQLYLQLMKGILTQKPL